MWFFQSISKVIEAIFEQINVWDAEINWKHILLQAHNIDIKDMHTIKDFSHT